MMAWATCPDNEGDTEMGKQYEIQVRKQGECYGQPGPVVETIKRVLRAEQIGNFCPLFCTYKGNKRVLVNSLEGDLSDPFRRDESYSRSFYIYEQFVPLDA